MPTVTCAGVCPASSSVILGPGPQGEEDRDEGEAQQEVPAQPGRRQATQYKLLVFTATSQVFFKSDSLHPYCKNACEANTMCGEVRVPEEHLEVQYSVH